MTPLHRDPYWLKKRVQERLHAAVKGRLMVFEQYKHGVLDTLDIANSAREIRTVIDVGANTGQSALRFRAAFPTARIISLEPVGQSFCELKHRVEGHRVECHQLALGPTSGWATIYLTRFSVTNSLVRPPDDEFLGEEEVQVQTLDDFVGDNSIDMIDLLKIDAEGYDLEVLKGGTNVLSEGKVRFIMIEVGFHPGDARHPLFDTVRDFLTGYGYHAFGIYGQTLEWTGEQSLRFANAVFRLNHHR